MKELGLHWPLKAVNSNKLNNFTCVAPARTAAGLQLLLAVQAADLCSIECPAL